MNAWDELRSKAAAGESVHVMEPPAGLTDSQRAIVEEAVQLMVNGEVVRAQALLADIGFSFTVERVKDGKLVPA